MPNITTKRDEKRNNEYTSLFCLTTDIIRREGCRARSKALGSGPSHEDVRGFESLPSHLEFFWVVCLLYFCIRALRFSEMVRTGNNGLKVINELSLDHQGIWIWLKKGWFFVKEFTISLISLCFWQLLSETKIKHRLTAEKEADTVHSNQCITIEKILEHERGRN